MKWSESLRSNVLVLAMSGLIPFILSFSGALLTDGDMRTQFISAYMTYAAVVIAFIGAVHWGVILNHPETAPTSQRSILTVGVLPGLLAWLALMVSVEFGLLIFCCSFPALYGFERFSVLKTILPAWYLNLRLILTLIVFCLTVTLFIKI